jgi:hypothetical protein
VELVESFIHSDFGESGLQLVRFEETENWFRKESLRYDVELFAFVDKVNLSFDFPNGLKIFPNSIIHPASGN